MNRLGILATIGLLAVIFMLPQPVWGQLNGVNIKGDVGLMSGSQPAPGIYLAATVYNDDTGRVNNASGEKVNPDHAGNGH